MCVAGVALCFAIAVPFFGWYFSKPKEHPALSIGDAHAFAQLQFRIRNEAFELSNKELRALEKFWNATYDDPDLSILDQLFREGFKLQYKAILTDGSTWSSDIWFGQVGDKYFGAFGVNISTGFLDSEWFHYLVCFEELFSKKRLEEFSRWIEMTKKE